MSNDCFVRRKEALEERRREERRRRLDASVPFLKAGYRTPKHVAAAEHSRTKGDEEGNEGQTETMAAMKKTHAAAPKPEPHPLEIAWAQAAARTKGHEESNEGQKAAMKKTTKAAAPAADPPWLASYMRRLAKQKQK